MNVWKERDNKSKNYIENINGDGSTYNDCGEDNNDDEDLERALQASLAGEANT